MSKTGTIIQVNRGYGKSMSNMIQMLSGEAEAEAATSEGYWVKIKKVEKNLYKIIDENMTDKNGVWIYDDVSLGFSEWDETVTDLDRGSSDASQCFGISGHLIWKDVDMAFDCEYFFKAPSIARIKEALQHVAICAWCPGDI